MKACKCIRFLTVAVVTALLAACVTKAKGPESVAARDYSDPAQLAALLSERIEPHFLVDVRTPGEYRAGHIPTAINTPYDKIAANPPTADTAALIIIYCASGGRAAMATKTLKALGYRRVVDFGAIGRWKGQLRKGNDPGACPCL